MASSDRPTLYRAITCNFCHRSEIAFAAKGIEIHTVDIDLVTRPRWFREMGSNGSVPLLVWDGAAIHPSNVINEYIEERWPDPPLFPEDLLERAAAREWIEWWNHGPCPAYERRLTSMVAERNEALDRDLDVNLCEMEARLAARGYDGGYWGGDSLGIVDATAAPMWVRFAGLLHFHGIDVPAELGRVRAWRETLLADPHVIATSPDPTELLGLYGEYIEVIADALAAGHVVRVAKGD